MTRDRLEGLLHNNIRTPQLYEKAKAEILAEHERQTVIKDAAKKLVDYRRRNTLNFQLEKADDYIRELEAAIRAAEEPR